MLRNVYLLRQKYFGKTTKVGFPQNLKNMFATMEFLLHVPAMY